MTQRPPLHRMKKTEILWLSTHRCAAHRHAFLDHYNCFLTEHPDQQKIGYLDLECSHLTADIGILLSYCIKVKDQPKICEGLISRHDIHKAGLKGDEDRAVVTKLVQDLKNFDVIVTYYGTGFDVPFMRTRAVAMGIPFPTFGTLQHVDCYYLVKFKFKLLSNRLKNANKILLGKTDKTEIDWRIWRAAARGNPKALAYVVDHNRKDVTDLEKLHKEIILYSRKTDRSI